MTGAAEVLNLEQLRETFGVVDAAAIELLNRFVEGTTVLVADMARAVAVRDADDARHVAHSIKGAARSAGADRLAALCTDLDMAIGAEAWDDAEAACAELGPALLRVKEAVTQLSA